MPGGPSTRAIAGRDGPHRRAVEAGTVQRQTFERQEASVSQRVEDEIEIDAPPSAVQAVITDIDSYPTWADGVRETEVLSTYPDGAPHRARFRIDVRIQEATYVVEYQYEGDEVTWSLVEGDLLKQLDGRYTLTPLADGSRTHVAFALEVDVAMPLPRYLKNRAARSILEQGLAKLKERVEGRS